MSLNRNSIKYGCYRLLSSRCWNRDPCCDHLVRDIDACPNALGSDGGNRVCARERRRIERGYTAYFSCGHFGQQGVVCKLWSIGLVDYQSADRLDELTSIMLSRLRRLDRISEDQLDL
ncbi:hypothetical protein XH88_30115 [Bradyrhizobium sp. CCBAU 51627]|nr:hypothetical protein [Bradyrhizobium sp. CCBAU 51627]